MAKCLKCSNALEEGVKFCSRCGSTLIEQETVAFRPGMPKTVQLLRLGTPAAAVAAARAAADSNAVPSVRGGAVGRMVEIEEDKERLQKELDHERKARADLEEEIDNLKHDSAKRYAAAEKLLAQAARIKKISRYAVPAAAGLILLLTILTLVGFSGRSRAVRELAEHRAAYDNAALASKRNIAERDSLRRQIEALNELAAAPPGPGNGGRLGGYSAAHVGGVKIAMVPVRGGAFKMGCTPEQRGDCDADEHPVRNVSVSGFLIGKYPVTQAQWRTVMGTNPSKFRGDRRPVEQVSWRDAQEFIKRLNQSTGSRYRLPTEAEWEFAARGGTSSRRHKYSGGDRIEEVAWYSSPNGTGGVGEKLANELGIHDMSGNVSEWVSDRYGAYQGDNVSNPTGPANANERVLRGGSWTNGAKGCRVSKRVGMASGARGNHIGFRLAHPE